MPATFPATQQYHDRQHCSNESQISVISFSPFKIDTILISNLIIEHQRKEKSTLTNACWMVRLAVWCDVLNVHTHGCSHHTIIIESEYFRIKPSIFHWIVPVAYKLFTQSLAHIVHRHSYLQPIHLRDWIA